MDTTVVYENPSEASATVMTMRMLSGPYSTDFTIISGGTAVHDSAGPFTGRRGKILPDDVRFGGNRANLHHV